MVDGSFRFFSFFSNKFWKIGYLNYIIFILVKFLGFLNNLGGRRRFFFVVDFLLISMCGSGVMY